jgi:hypothetical protein
MVTFNVVTTHALQRKTFYFNKITNEMTILYIKIFL